MPILSLNFSLESYRRYIKMLPRMSYYRGRPRRRFDVHAGGMGMEMEEGKREGEGERRKQACMQALLSGWIDLVVCSMFAKEKKGEGRREIKHFTRSIPRLLACSFGWLAVLLAG